MLKIKQSLVDIGLILTIATIIGKILGFLRDVLISYYYGSSAITDALFLALSIPTTLLGVFTYSADSAIIPQYLRLKKNTNRKTADKLFSVIINWLGSIGIIVTILLFFFPTAAIKLFAPKFEMNQVEYAVAFLRILCAGGLLHIISCFFSAYITSYQQTTTRAISCFLTNAVVTLTLLIIHDKNMISVACSYLIASIMSTSMPIIAAKQLGYKHTLSFKYDNVEINVFVKNFVPIMATALLNDLNIFVDKYLASGMGEGAISALNYGNKIPTIFDSMIVVGIGVVILPLFANINLETELERFRKITRDITKWSIILLLPLSVITAVFSKEIITVLFYRGSFDMEAVNTVSAVLTCYAPRITFAALSLVLSRIFYAREDTRTPLILSSISIAINVLLSILLSRKFGIGGLALGSSISSIFLVTILCVMMGRKTNISIFRWKEVLKIIGANLTFFACVFFLRGICSSCMGRIVLTLGISLPIYFVIIYILNQREMKALISYLINTIRRRAK